MGFNGLGFFTLGPLQSIRVFVRRSGGQDFGAQWIMANPLNPGVALEVSGFTKRRENDNTVTYLATVRNLSNVNTNFDLQGGGNIGSGTKASEEDVGERPP